MSSSSGPLYPTSTSSLGDGDYSWFDITGVQQIGGLIASGAIAGAGSIVTLDTLRNTGFGFSIPTGATILGIVVNLNRHASNAPTSSKYYVDKTVRLLKAGTPVGDNKANTSLQWDNSAYITRPYGSEFDLWGTTWTPSDINNANFGVDVQPQGKSTTGTVSGDIDYINIVVYYSVTPTANTYSVTINGVERSGDISWNTLVIEDVINDKQNTCSFELVDRSGNGIPSNDQEVVVTVNGTREFGGYVVNVSLSKKGTVKAKISCIDYVRILDRNLAHKSYEDMTDAAIISDLVNTYCPATGVTTTNVVSGVTISQITFNYIQISQVMRKICDLTGRNWYIDYNKDIHYFPLTQNAAPFNITSTNTQYSNLYISKDASQLKNRVYVRGGTYLSDYTTHSEKGDGEKTKFVLPDKPHDVSVTVNGVSKTVGIKNVDTSGFDWYLNFQEKYVEQDSGGSILSDTDVLAVTYKYDIPILVAVENTASIISNGVQEFAIFDKSISTTQAARDRASAELTDYANNLIEGSFTTFTTGFRSGQYININLSEYGVSADYIVQKVVSRSLGAGLFTYTVSIASAKTMGIIRFLIELLEANKNLIELDSNEVVDELLSVQDSLLSDSLTDALTIDSTGPYFTWCTDSLTATPITRMRWDLFQWG